MMNGITWTGIHSMTLGFPIPSLVATTSSSPAIHATLTPKWHHLHFAFCTGRGGRAPNLPKEVVTTQTAMEARRGAQYSQDGYNAHLFPRRLHWMHLFQ